MFFFAKKVIVKLWYPFNNNSIILLKSLLICKKLTVAHKFFTMAMQKSIWCVAKMHFSVHFVNKMAAGNYCRRPKCLQMHFCIRPKELHDGSFFNKKHYHFDQRSSEARFAPSGKPQFLLCKNLNFIKMSCTLIALQKCIFVPQSVQKRVVCMIVKNLIIFVTNGSTNWDQNGCWI